MVTLSLSKPSTRVIKKLPKFERPLKDSVKAYRAHVTKAYPSVFNPADPKPLAIGIGKVLLETRPPGISKRAVRIFMSRWTRSAKYHKRIKNGGYRYGLNGMPDGIISPEHQSSANLLPVNAGPTVEK